MLSAHMPIALISSQYHWHMRLDGQICPYLGKCPTQNFFFLSIDMGYNERINHLTLRVLSLEVKAVAGVQQVYFQSFIRNFLHKINIEQLLKGRDGQSYFSKCYSVKALML